MDQQPTNSEYLEKDNPDAFYRERANVLQPPDHRASLWRAALVVGISVAIVYAVVWSFTPTPGDDGVLESKIQTLEEANTKLTTQVNDLSRRVKSLEATRAATNSGE